MRPPVAPAILLACASLAAQDQRPVFRAGTNLVTVDAYPKRDGQFVDGLTAQDFEVFEDGKPQKIEAFELVHAPPPATDAELRDPNTQADALTQAADPYARLFVLYLDTYTTSPEGAKRLRQPLLDFLRRTISARDLFGVLMPDSNIKDLTFSRRLETLEHDLEQFWVWARESTPRTTPQEQWLEKCYDLRTQDPGTNDWIVATLKKLRRLDLLFTGLETLVPTVGSIREQRTNVMLVSDGFLPIPPTTRLQEFAWGTGGPPPVGVRGGTLRVNPRLGEDRTSPNADKISCDQELLRLASLDFERRFRDLMKDARRANVAFFPVKAELIGGIDFRAGPAIFDDSATGTLRNLAEETGGLALVLNDLAAGFREFSSAMSGYYLLGYASTNAKADGRYHRIEVKVKQPHVDVMARSGYVAAAAPSSAPALVPVNKPATAKDAALEAALGELARIQPSAEIYTAAVSRSLGVDVIVELAADLAPKFSTGADVLLTLSNNTGQTVATVRGLIAAGERSVLILVSRDILPTQVDRVAVKVTGPGSAIEATTDIPLRADSALGLAEAFRTVTRARQLPVADYQFRRSERLHLEWVQPERFEQADARLLGRDGRPLAVPVVIANQIDGPPPHKLMADCNLAPLAPGDYVIELSATIGGTRERSLVAFRVVR